MVHERPQSVILALEMFIGIRVALLLDECPDADIMIIGQ